MKNKNKLITAFCILAIIMSFILTFLASCISISITDAKVFKDAAIQTLSDPNYWLVTVSVAVCLCISYFAFYFLRRNKNLNSEDFAKQLKEYNDRLKLKPANFADFCRIDNLEEKTRVYKEKINDKIAKLESKYIKIPNEKLKGKRAIKIQAKIKKLKDQLAEDFIKKNILHMRVKYTEIHPKNYRKNNYGIIADERKDFSNEGGILAGKGVTKVGTSVAISAAFSVLLLAGTITLGISTTFFLIIFTTSFSMLLNAIFGSMLADKVYRNEILIPLENKILILERAVAWANKTPEKTFREVIQIYIDEKTKEIEEKKKEEEKQKLEVK